MWNEHESDPCAPLSWFLALEHIQVDAARCGQARVTPPTCTRATCVNTPNTCSQTHSCLYTNVHTTHTQAAAAALTLPPLSNSPSQTCCCCICSPGGAWLDGTRAPRQSDSRPADEDPLSHLVSLPSEILGEVMNFLDGRSLARAECVSRALRDAARDSSAWLSVLRGEAGVSIIATATVGRLVPNGAPEHPRNGHRGDLRLWNVVGDTLRCAARSAYMSRMRERAAGATVITEYAAAWSNDVRLRPARATLLTVLRWTHLVLGISGPFLVFNTGLLFLVVRLDGDAYFAEWSWQSQLALLAYGPGLLLADGALAALISVMRHICKACPRFDVFRYARCDGPWRVMLHGASGSGGGGGGTAADDGTRWARLIFAARAVFLFTYLTLLTAFLMLLGAKLDGALAWSWTAVFSPLWLALPMTCCLVHVGATALARDDGVARAWMKLAVQIASVGVLFSAVSVAAKLDGAVVSWTVAFLPIWIFDFVLVGGQLTLIALFAGQQQQGRARRAAAALAWASGVVAVDAALMGTPLLVVLKLEGLSEGSWLFACLPMLVSEFAAGIACVVGFSWMLESPDNEAEFAPPCAPTAAAVAVMPWTLANNVAV